MNNNNTETATEKKKTQTLPFFFFWSSSLVPINSALEVNNGETPGSNPGPAYIM
jgi:hypothetical protein